MKKHCFHRFAALLLAMVLALSICVVPAFAADEITVKNNVYKEGIGIRVALSATVGETTDEFTVTGPDGEVEIASVTVDASKNSIYTIVTVEPLDVYADYTLTFRGQTCEVKMPIIYSTSVFEEAYTYTGDDLGASYTPEATTLRVWAPTAQAVAVRLYTDGDPSVQSIPVDEIDMTADVNGTWFATLDGDMNGTYYTYLVTVGEEVNEACDPYARTTGVNGKRGMIIDLDATDPQGWDADTDPHFDDSITDAVIYELHVRDLSINESSGITNKGKYLGLIETGTTNSAGVPTGLDHIKNLGVTHIHLLPVYDYGSVDESKLDIAQFNWGYDPVNYNVPEGSYATDPYHGEVRVREFKQMVKGLHDNGISVIMDVVYNHVYNADAFCFNRIVPGYFSRISDTGVYSAGSGCGNDTASERSMVSKYIVDSVKYWADEYHIDGFRFDLVGLIDTDTINTVVEEVHKTHPNVIFYGEGWTMSTVMTKDGYTMTTQQNSEETPDFAFFSDTIRDALRGPMSSDGQNGYLGNAGGYASNVKKCFLGNASWCNSPTQAINYASCHDNLALFDKLILSNTEASMEELIRMNNLSAAIVMTSQGVPFFQAGEEMLRSKPLGDGSYDHNSYRSPDAVNSLKWDDLNEEAYQGVYNYYKGLIAFRQAHPALRMTAAEEVEANITSLSGLDSNVNAFHINGGVNGEESDGMVVVFNPRKEATTVALPEGDWTIYVNGENAGTTPLGTASGSVSVDAVSAMVLVKEAAQSDATDPTEDSAGSTMHIGGIVLIAVASVAVIAVAVILVLVKKNKK